MSSSGICPYKVKMTILPQQEQVQNSSQVEIVLWAKNTLNLQEYCLRIPIDQNYLEKHEKWINKKRYAFKELSQPSLKQSQFANSYGQSQIQINTQSQRESQANDTIVIIINQMFQYQLKKISRNDFDILKDEFKLLKEQDAQLQREMRLFNYQFFNPSNDFSNPNFRNKMQCVLIQQLGDEYRSKIVENVESMFDKYEGIGFQQEDPNLPGHIKNLILLKEPISMDYFQNVQQFSGGMAMNMMQRSHQSSGSKQMEVLLFSPSQQSLQNSRFSRDDQSNQQVCNDQLNLINISKQQSLMMPMTIQDPKTGMMSNYYGYEVDRQVKQHENYELLLSKLQRAS
eukprot:403358975